MENFVMHLSFFLGMPRITTVVLWSKVAMIPTCIHKTMVLGWLCCIHIHPHFKFIYEYALLINDDQCDYQCLAFSSQLLVNHIATVWIGKDHFYYSSFFQCIFPDLLMGCNLPWHPLHSLNLAEFFASKQRRMHLEHEHVSMGKP
jgi:hypothetical protein